MVDEVLENTCFTFSLFVKNEQLLYLCHGMKTIFIEASSQVLFIPVVPVHCTDALKLVCTLLINLMVFLDKGK